MSLVLPDKQLTYQSMWKKKILITCLTIPEFVVALERKYHPEQATHPLVVYEGERYKSTIYAMCDVAKRAGVKLGMTKSSARALCPDAIEFNATLKRYDETAQTLCETLLAITEKIEYDQNSSLSVWLDCGTISSQEAEQISEYISQAVYQIIPVVPFIGIARGRRTARIAALTGKRGHLHWVTPDMETDFLASMSLLSFAGTPKLRQRFDLFGLKTIADLSRLPFDGVKIHFGKVGAELHKLAHGQDRYHLAPYRVREREQRSHSFDFPLNDSVMIETIFTQIARDVSIQLLKRGLVCSEATLTLHCEDKTILEVTHTLRESIQTQKALLFELNRLLSKISLSSGIIKIVGRFDKLVPAQPIQLDFLETIFRNPEDIVVSIAKRLHIRHQESKFNRLVLSDFHSDLFERNATLQSVIV
jgi:DNA polymerase IV